MHQAGINGLTGDCLSFRGLLNYKIGSPKTTNRVVVGLVEKLKVKILISHRPKDKAV